jgi:YidC/Oxa1 family membrane protein insertase
VKELTTEQRLLLALVLSIVVVTLSDLLVFRHNKPAPKQQNSSAQVQKAQKPAPPAATAAQPPAQSAARKPQPARQPAAVQPAPAQKSAAAIPQIAATKEQNIVVESSLYRVVLSNRGAVVRSWELNRYKDDAKPPKVLNVVHPPKTAGSDEWPLSLLMIDPKLQSEANGALYEVKQGSGTMHAPATVEFTWSNGHLSITKRIRFGTGYVTHVQTSVTLDGQPVVYALAWRGGFGDATAYEAYEKVKVFYSSDGKVETLAYKKLGTSDHPNVPASINGPLEFAGIEDQYFAAAFLPTQGQVSAWDWLTNRQKSGAKPGETEPVSEVAVGPPQSAPGPAHLELFVGPKSLRELGAVDPKLRSLVDFGIMSFLAEPLFYVLRWIHDYVPNWGWAIVLLTVGLTMALFPLRMSSWRSMQKMQKVMPEMKAIQARYKKYGMRDPRRQKMNEEMMELYKREGVNPMGSCLPMLLQMPVWFALFEVLEVSIQLRHAPWILWIHDLSAHDPYYILPILMTIAGYLMQKMTPQTMTDPNQQKMMNLMPVAFGLLFFRLQSGLILYIFTSYLLGIGQQWYLNKTSPYQAPAAGKAAGKKPKPEKPKPKKQTAT